VIKRPWCCEAPNDLSSTTLRPLGPRCHAHCVGEDVHAAQHPVARFSSIGTKLPLSSRPPGPTQN
jgi:hypothetical protein